VLTGRPIVPRRDELDDLILNAIPPRERPAAFAAQVEESSRAGTQIAYGRISVDPARVACPVLSVVAGRDRLVLPEVGEQLAHRYDGEIAYFADRGHYALVCEPGWPAVADAICDWLDKATAT
jgi:pimeloyl-ACP methyl ester carboxylesterase